jgi:hypothetical protein
VNPGHSHPLRAQAPPGAGVVVRPVPGVLLRRPPAAEPVVYPGEFSLAGAVGRATGLSLRSPRTVKIFFRDAGGFGAGEAGALSFFAR